MAIQGPGADQELDLESILEEFDPANQVNNAPRTEPDTPEEEAPKGEKPQVEVPKVEMPKDEEPKGEKRRRFGRKAQAKPEPEKTLSEPEDEPKEAEVPKAQPEAEKAEGEEPKVEMPEVEVPEGEKRRRFGRKAKAETKPGENAEEKAEGKPGKSSEGKAGKAPSEERTKKGSKNGPEGNIIEFPGEEMGLTKRLSRLVEKSDRYAEKMFPDDDRDPDTQELKRERLLPGVDYEDEPTHAPEPRKKRVIHHPKPDLTAAQLAGKYKKGLAFLRVRVLLALILTLGQIYLLLGAEGHLPLLPILRQGNLLTQVAALALAVSALVSVDTLAKGLLGIFKLRLEAETLLLMAVIATAADAVTMPLLNSREGAMPYTAAASAAIFFALWGRYTKRKAQRLNARTVAGRKEPYLVTLDEKAWNGEDAYMKWSGELTGFGSQVQDTDGAQRVYHRAAPVILLLALVLTLFASVGAKKPENFFWCLSATLLAGCGFSGFLVFSHPYDAVVKRLSKAGAALGGWDSLSWTGRHRGVVVTDGDLFPPGAVKLNGIKLIGDILSLETAVSYVATLVRETGSGMEKPFSDMMRAQGGLFRRASQVVCHEGGVTGIISGEQVIVGSAAFLELMGIEPPQGLKVKNAVFLGVDGHLAAIFALNYRLHPTVKLALESLIANHLDPILATRDFLVIPDMLQQRFKLRVENMEFPSLDRRRELSSTRVKHDENIAALLCREGLGPYAEAVIGGKRLVGAVRAGAFFALLGSLIGMALAFYLTLAEAYASLSAGSLLLFLLLWLVPEALIAGWADQY